MNLIFLFWTIFPYPSQLCSTFCRGIQGKIGDFSWRLELRQWKPPLTSAKPQCCSPSAHFHIGNSSQPFLETSHSVLLQGKLQTLNMTEITSGLLFHTGITSPPQPLSLSHPVTNLPYHSFTLGTPPLCPSDSENPLCLLPGMDCEH